MTPTEILVSVVDAAIVLAFLYGAKLLADWSTNFDDDREIEQESNLAVGLRRAGLYLGMAVALMAAISGNAAENWLKDIGSLLVEGTFALVALFAARMINDKLLLGGINNDQQVLGKNTAVGLVEFGHFVATGLIINGSIVGEGGGIISVAVWFVIGQLALLALAWVYEAITPYNVATQIRDNNAAAGVSLAGMLIALGIIMRYSMMGPFTGWATDLAAFGWSLGVGIGMLLVLRYIVDHLFLPNAKLHEEIERDKNVAALVMANGVLVALSMIIGAAL